MRRDAGRNAADMMEEAIDHLLAAIRHAADAGGASIAARYDPTRAGMWRVIAEDQGRLAARALSRLAGRQTRSNRC